MAIRFPIASGNWSNSAIWSGSIIPTVGDDVAANGFTVTIDQDINVAQLRTLTTGSAASGGGFILNDNYTITANINSGTTNCLTFNSGSTGFTLNGDVDSINNTANITVLTINGTGTININGNIKRTTARNGGSVLTINSAPTVNISGSISPVGSTISQDTIVINSTGTTLNVIGPITILSSPANNIPVIRINSVTCNININGNISTNFTTNPIITTPGAGSIITVTGSVTTNGTTGGQLVSTSAIIQVYITGSLNAGTSSTLNLTGNSIVIIQGPISSSISAPGVTLTGTGATNLFTGPFYNTGSFNAVYAYRMQILGTSSQWTFDTETAGVTKTLYTSNQLPGVPRENNVRKGTTYNFGLTGSLAMPDPTTVKTGVVTDNTTGSAIFTAEDMFNVATQNLTTSGSIGNLLTGASTVQTVGATISSFKV